MKPWLNTLLNCIAFLILMALLLLVEGCATREPRLADPILIEDGLVIYESGPSIWGLATNQANLDRARARAQCAPCAETIRPVFLFEFEDLRQ